MVTFTFDSVIAEGSAKVDQQTGKTTQSCTVVTRMSGLNIGDKLLTDTVDFEVNNSLSIIDAWLDIRDVKVPAWVAENYSAA